jgi:hypothetical protein
VHWFNNTRLHSSIGYTTPIDYETAYYRHNDPRPRPLSAKPSLYKSRGASDRKWPSAGSTTIAP